MEALNDQTQVIFSCTDETWCVESYEDLSQAKHMLIHRHIKSDLHGAIEHYLYLVLADSEAFLSVDSDNI